MRALRRRDLVLLQLGKPLSAELRRCHLEQGAKEAAQIRDKPRRVAPSCLQQQATQLGLLDAARRIRATLAQLPLERLHTESRQRQRRVDACAEVADPKLVVDLGVVAAEIG
jgi:hypothetical protein